MCGITHDPPYRFVFDLIYTTQRGDQQNCDLSVGYSWTSIINEVFSSLGPKFYSANDWELVELTGLHGGNYARSRFEKLSELLCTHKFHFLSGGVGRNLSLLEN